ncbi:MAG: ATP-binding protein [Akkermansiaceae bacterium]
MMIFPQSIRWRIQLWYLLLLAVIIVALLVAFYRNQREIKYQVLDRGLSNPITRLLPRMERRLEPPPRNRRLPRPDPLDEFGDNFEGGLRPGSGPEGRGRRSSRGGGRLEDREERGPTLDEMVEELAEDDIFVIRWDSDGEASYISKNSPEEPRPFPDEVPRGRNRVSKRTVEGYREIIHASPNGGFLLVGASVEPTEAELSKLETKLIGIGFLIVGGGFLVGWLLIGRSLKPIETISGVAHRIAEGDLSERIMISESGSELGQLSNVLNETFDKLETSFEHQVRFTADASHEMRTPISVILAKSQFALSKERSIEKYQDALQTCMDSAQHMRTLTDGLLELSKVDSGEFNLRLEPGNFEDLTREVLKMIAPLADEREIKVECDLESVKAEFDSQKMRQALLNLLSNAVKYNHERGEILVGLKKVGEEAHWSVRDTGLGMDVESLEHVFERFFQVNRARTRKGRNGTGLGLPITKAIVEAHGGTIAVESKVGQGAVFRLVLPAQ